MKKIYLLAIALLAMISSHAQNIDLALHHLMGTNGRANDTVIYQDTKHDTTYFLWEFINRGPGTIIATDSIKLHTPIKPNGLLTIYFPAGTTVAVGDSIAYGVAVAEFTSSQALGANNSTFNWCDSAYLVHMGGALATDPVLSNNIICTNVIIHIAGAGVQTIANSALATLNLYPNPATDVVNFTYDFIQSSKVNVMITDVIGRQVYSEDFGTVAGKKDFSIDINKLSAGMYIMQLNIDDKKLVSKFSVQK